MPGDQPRQRRASAEPTRASRRTGPSTSSTRFSGRPRGRLSEEGPAGSKRFRTTSSMSAQTSRSRSRRAPLASARDARSGRAARGALRSCQRAAGAAPGFVLPENRGRRAAARRRAVCRRAERRAAALAQAQDANSAALAYLNRLSDLLYILARAASAGSQEPPWRPGLAVALAGSAAARSWPRRSPPPRRSASDPRCLGDDEADLGAGRLEALGGPGDDVALWDLRRSLGGDLADLEASLAGASWRRPASGWRAWARS